MVIKLPPQPTYDDFSIVGRFVVFPQTRPGGNNGRQSTWAVCGLCGRRVAWGLESKEAAVEKAEAQPPLPGLVAEQLRLDGEGEKVYNEIVTI